MKIALIGLPNSGKTTIFNALTRSEAEVRAYADVKAEPNIAVVEVVDDRVTCLSAMYDPKKTVYATIEVIDFAGIPQGSAKNGGFPETLMRLMRTADAVAAVVRNFEDEQSESAAPLRDIDRIDGELLLSDLILVENRLDRIEWSHKRGKRTNDLDLEEKTLRKILAQLEHDQPIRDLVFDRDEQKVIRGFQFLTQKPLMVILNSDDRGFGTNRDLLAEIEKKHRVIEFAGQFEMELSRLKDDEDAKLFMDDMGINRSARDRLTQFAYETLGYISFFTVGADEVRAWNIREGTTTREAAGTIHTDLARGFIRAECFRYDDLVELGSEKAIRQKGLFRLEGKNYIVQDGNILSIRFAV